MERFNFNKHVIGWRLTVALVIFSAFITLVTSAYQVYDSYRADIRGIEQRMQEISEVHVNEITDRVWTANKEDLNKVLLGLLSLTDIAYLQVIDGGSVIAAAGQKQSKRYIENTFPLQYHYKDQQLQLGKLVVQATLMGVHERLVSQVVVILISNGIQTFLVIGFVLFLFYNMVTRHLEKISAYAEHVNIEKANEPLSLSRKKADTDQNDELDRLVLAICNMQDRIQGSYTELKESEQRFRQLAENIEGVFWIGSADWHKIFYISPSYQSVWGQDPARLYDNARAWLDCVHPDDKAMVLEDIQQKAKGDWSTAYFSDYRIVFGDGAIRWISARAYPIRDESGNIKRVAGFADDITASKMATLKLSKSEARFRGLMEAAADGIMVVNQAGVIVLANAAAESMFGYKTAELHQQPVARLFAQQDDENELNHDSMWQAPLSLTRRVLEGITGLKKAGSEFPLEIGLTPLHMDDEAVVVVTLHDVTEKIRASDEREQLQKQLQQSQKMESIGQLTGGIAHDFNNLLASILGYTQLARTTLDEDRSGVDEALQYLAEVEKAGGQARELIAQMLAFSRREEGEMSETWVALIVKESTKMIRSVLPTSIVVETKIEDEVPAILGNAVQLHQVLMNLIVNARDAMIGQGSLLIQVGKVCEPALICSACKMGLKGYFVEVAVADTGNGIPAAIIDRIFEPFFTSKEVGKGTGMGLAMVHGIVHSHGGHILVQSSEYGTRFRLLFPIKEIAADGAPSANRVAHESLGDERHGNAHILVVDDEPAVAEMLSKILKKQGYQVTLSTDSREAWSLFSHHPQGFDLVITDQTMPGMNGTDLSRKILSMRADMPIVLCTGYSENIDERIAKEIGIKAYYLKPLDTTKLLAVIRSLTQHYDAA